jgi:hypothetical protein
MPSILPKLPKYFPFLGMRAVRSGHRGCPLFRRHDRRPKHGYEVMTNLLTHLIDARIFIRVISSILPRIIEGLTHEV